MLVPPSPAPTPPRKPHRIRLRGPWEWIEPTGAPAPARLPFTAPAAGTLCRQFNTPTGLEDGTTVRLAVDAGPSGPPAMVNDVSVDESTNDDRPAEITPLLGEAGARCRLELTLSAGDRVEAVALELHLPGPLEAAQTDAS